MERFPATIELSLAAMCLAGFIGVLAGIMSATRQYSLLDSGFMFLSLAGVSMPIFWLGLMMIWTFALVLGLVSPVRTPGCADFPRHRSPAFTSSIAC